jgi:hypothetical protein
MDIPKNTRMRVNNHGLLYFQYDGRYYFSDPDLGQRADFPISGTDPDSITVADFNS